MTKKPLIVVAAAVSVCALAIVIFSFYQVSKFDQGVMTVKKTGPAVSAAQKIPRKITPSRPEDCGIIVVEDKVSTRAQGDWDKVAHSIFTEMRSDVPKETWDRARQKMEIDPQKIQVRIKEIDDSIQKCEEELKKDPSSLRIKEKLESLKFMRSIAKELG